MKGTGSLKHVYFPIADTIDQYNENKSWQLKGISDEALQTIDAMKPYRDGNDQLWRLHRLNNIDKHRLLIAVGSAFRSFDFAAIARGHTRKQATDWPEPEHVREAFAKMPKMTLFYKPADRMCPLKVGDELFVDAPDAEFNPEIQFRFDIALAETGIVEGEEIMETLQGMVSAVKNAVTTLEPFTQ